MRENRPHHRFAPTARCGKTALIIGLRQRRDAKKTAEERFHTLARGWLAYPVTPMHARLPPKSGCINVIPRFALSRRRATALFRNPVRKAQRSVPGFSSTPTSACRRYATSPPSAVAIRHRPPSSSDCASTSSAIHLYALRRCAPAPTAQAVTPSVNPRPRRGYTHRRICAAERRR